MAWTKAITKLSPRHSFKRGDGRTLFCYKLAVVSDTSASGDITLSTELATTYGAKEGKRLMEQMGTYSLYWVDFVAGTSTEEPTLTIDSNLAILVFTADIADGEVDEGWTGTTTTTYAPMTDTIIACGALAAAATKTATFYFWFIR